ncbi:MAG: COX15/CtaA family protein [Halanaeroarchaeum sp.]
MDATASGRSTSSRRRIDGFLTDHARTVVALTTAFTFGLLLLGEFTAATGSGATCNFTYPGCAGQLSPVGLSVPQFIEWFHRLVAMLAGFVILGNALVLWRAFPGTRISRAGWLAALLLPFQVFVGGVTVTFANMVPGGYAPPVQLLHFVVAFAIFVSLVAALVWTDAARGHGASRERLYLLAIVGLGLAGFQSLFARDLVFTFWPSVQAVYHFLGHLAIATFVAAALWARELGNVDAAIAATAGATIGTANTLLVIGIFVITPSVQTVTYLLLAGQLGLFAWLAWIASRPRSSDPL